MPTERKLVRVQEKGQVTLPMDVRRRLGLKKGDLVAVVDTEDGVLVTPQAVLATRALDRIGEALRQSGVSLEQLIDSGRQIRGRMIEKEYGIRPDDQ
jgi:AbrB family looped-hinge helix DNA binding protein